MCGLAIVVTLHTGTATRRSAHSSHRAARASLLDTRRTVLVVKSLNSDLHQTQHRSIGTSRASDAYTAASSYIPRRLLRTRGFSIIMSVFLLISEQHLTGGTNADGWQPACSQLAGALAQKRSEAGHSCQVCWLPAQIKGQALRAESLGGARMKRFRDCRQCAVGKTRGTAGAGSAVALRLLLAASLCPDLGGTRTRSFRDRLKEVAVILMLMRFSFAVFR